MQGSCEPPGPDAIGSTFQPRPNIPQALTNWVPTPPQAAAPPLLCPKSLDLGSQSVNCFSFLCDSQTYINNVPVVTCHCPIGESLAGTPVPPQTSFLTQAGQGNQAYCDMYPVSGPIEHPEGAGKLCPHRTRRVYRRASPRGHARRDASRLFDPDL